MSSPSSWVIAAATRSADLNGLLSWGLDPPTVAVVRHDAGVVALAGGFRRPFARYWLSINNQGLWTASTEMRRPTGPSVTR